MNILFGFLFLAVALLIYKNNKKSYFSDYIELGHRIQGFGLMLILIVVAVLLFVGKIKFV